MELEKELLGEVLDALIEVVMKHTQGMSENNVAAVVTLANITLGDTSPIITTVLFLSSVINNINNA